MQSQIVRHTLPQSVVEQITVLQTQRALRRFLLCRGSLLSPRIAKELQEIARSTMHVNSRRALAIASAALLIAQKLSELQLVANASRIKANILCKLGKPAQALKLHRRALSLLRDLGDRDGLARTLSASIQPMILLGRYSQAVTVAAEARQLLVESRDTRHLAMLENNIGNIYHRQDRFEEALSYYQRAYELLIPFKDTENLLIAFNNLAMCLTSLNDFSRAADFYRLSLCLSETESIPELRMIADYNIAYLYFLRGQYRHAISLLQSTRQLCEHSDNRHLLGLCHLDLSDIYLELNLSKEALEAAEKAYTCFLAGGLTYESARARVNQAIAHGQMLQTARSIELFVESRQQFVEEGNRVWPHLIDLYEAIVLAQDGGYDEALRLCTDAAEFFDSSAMPGKRVLCHLVLSRLSSVTGDNATARLECAKALKILKTIDAPNLRLKSFLILGELERTQGSRRAAYNALQRARSELESLWCAIDRDEVRLAFMKDKGTVYESLACLCLASSGSRAALEEAFTYVELGKSRSLVEGLRLGGEQREDGIAQAHFRRIRGLGEELSWFQHRLELEQLQPSENSKFRIQTFDQEMQKRWTQLRRIAGESSPDALRNSNKLETLKPLSLDEIRDSLPKEVTLLEYFICGDDVFVAALERNTLHVQSVSTVTRIVPLLRALRFQLENASRIARVSERLSTQDLEATRSHLEALHRELISPIASKFSGSHLVVVPHGPLHHVPFHALVDSQRYLVDSFSISYAPSASAFALCQRRPSRAMSSDLILGVPDARAPYILDEARTVHELLCSSTLLIGKEATRAALHTEGSRSRFIHLATHAQFRRDNPAFSGLRLGDSFLYVYELLEFDLPSDLLVLSGCATAMSVISGCDEQLGLARAALLAGVRSALLTLWNVHDGSAAQFMKSFYTHLIRSDDHVASYRQALVEQRQQYPHPYHWAPFYLTGGAA